MIIDYVGVKEINGSLIVIDGVRNASFDEIVEIRLENGTRRQGRIVQIDGERIVVQVFEGTRNLSLKNTRTRLTGHPMEISLSPEIIGRVFNGVGRPIDGLGEIFPEKTADINGTPINPVSRIYPQNYINIHNRHPYDSYKGAKASYIFRFGNEPQRACCSDRAAGKNCR